ncbi:protein ELYS-like isoform X2 [Palaemon carinicauda]|uniref:protein ELYS-like isoform X2 n=1 Tax=Palaemon carinicauda TaxID=392227 RepID=UPI0035B6715D
MATGSVVQVGNGVRHIPLPPFASSLELNLGQEHGDEEIGTVSKYPVIGGFIGSGQLAWRAAGPTVEVVDPGSGARKAAWTFGAIMHNAGAKVTTVCGVGLGTVSQVAIGVDLGADRAVQGLVALLSLHSSRVTRVFHFTHKVTSLAMVSGGEVSIDSGTLAPELRPWHGIIVIGTAHGTLHLLDLALDLGGHKVTSDELSPASLRSVATPDPQAERNRINVVRQQCHLTMCLSDGMSHGGRFQLIGPDDSILFETSSHLVTITAIKFIPQLASLVVGYNFGAFQIINLSTLTIDCTSPYEDNVPPVHSFACQEPENDPKNFVYLWLCRSWNFADGHIEKQEKHKRETPMAALCTMYAMNYDKKLWIEGHGLWYQGLASISPRFEFTATGGLGLKGQPPLPSCVFVAMTVQQAIHNSTMTPGASAGISTLATPDEDSGPVPEQSLCFFGWAGKVLVEGSLKLSHYLAVFDINQWYQAQMPSNLKLLENHLCPFMSFHMLDRVPGCSTDGSLSEVVLGAAPKPASWARHMSHSCTENDWFPASLSYDCYVLTNEGLMEYQCQSAQQAALNYLTSCGPSAIVNPEAAYSMCLFSGLIAHDSPPSSGSSMMLEREALLTVALDEQLVSFLLQCVNEFAEGRFTNLGCSLPSLLEWSWSRVCSLKSANDSLCMPMFDIDSGVMSSSSILALHQNLTSLSSLTTVITAIRDCAQTNLITLQGAGELESRVQVVELLMLHINVVLWFYHCGLLSHDNAVEDVEEFHHVPFPAELLHRIYNNRRLEIKNLSSTLKGNEILLIDGLLEDAVGGAGGHINKTWVREDEDEAESGSYIEGAYPPPSLHALLDIFLLPNVSTTTKHRIVQYLFLDLASLLSDGYVRVVEELVKYPSSFSLSPSHIKLTQAFWLLDHKDFQEGLNVLLDPLVNTRDITPLQHQRIVKAFLYQGEHTRALTYNQIRQPPRVNMDDIRLHLTLLLANGLIREAFHFQRQHRLKDNAEDLLNHFFIGCEQLGKLENVIHLPLSPMEEETLVTYLQTSPNKAAHDYLLVYYLQRSRFEDAALLQDIIRGGYGMERKRQGVRSALIHGYLTHLPDVAKKITSSNAAKQMPARTMYNKPQPLSAKIHQARFSPKSHAGMLEKIMEDKQKAGTSFYGMNAPFTPFRNKSQRRQGLDLPDEYVYEDISLKRKSVTKDISQVVFPSRIMDLHSPLRNEDGEIGLFSPVPKFKSHGESGLLGEDMTRMMESILRKSVCDVREEAKSPAQTISADLLSLLRTPKVSHKKRQSMRGAGDSLLADTPQSILKVKQTILKPISPASSETSLPSVFPRIATSARKSQMAEESQQIRATDCSLTPKQLRFHLPKGKIDANGISNQSFTESSKDESVLIPVEELEKETFDVEEEHDGDERTSFQKEEASELEKSLSDAEYMEVQDEENEDNERSFMSVDIGDKFERSIEVQEEEASLDVFEDSLEEIEGEEGTDREAELEVLEKSIEVGGEPAEQSSVEINVLSNEEITGKIEATLTEEFSIEEEKVVEDSFYSFTEEKISDTQISEGVEEKEGESEKNLAGAERSFEVGGDDEDEPICLEAEHELKNSVHEEEDTIENRRQDVDDQDQISEPLEGNESEKEEEMKLTLEMENEDTSVHETQKSDEVEECSEENVINEVDDGEGVKLMLDEVSQDDKSLRTVFEEFEQSKTSVTVKTTVESSVTQNLNDSEYITSLRFSDSESDAEKSFVEENKSDETKNLSIMDKMEVQKGRVVAALNENLVMENLGLGEAVLGDSTIRSDGNGIEDNILQLASEKEEEMITPEMINEALSEEESFVLNLDASEHFSPLNFSDDSDLEKEPEEADPSSPDIKEALLSREGILKPISVDEAKVAIAEGAEENSMEANMPEEESVKASALDVSRRVDEIVPENDPEPVIPEMEIGDAENKPQEVLGHAKDVHGKPLVTNSAKSDSSAEFDQFEKLKTEDQVQESDLKAVSDGKEIVETRVSEESSLCEKDDIFVMKPEITTHSEQFQDSEYSNGISEGIEEMETDENCTVAASIKESNTQRKELQSNITEVQTQMTTETECISIRENKEIEECNSVFQNKETVEIGLQKEPEELTIEADSKMQDTNLSLEKKSSSDVLDNSKCVTQSLSNTVTYESSNLETTRKEQEIGTEIPASEHKKDVMLKESVVCEVESLSIPTSPADQTTGLTSSNTEFLSLKVKEHPGAVEDSTDGNAASFSPPPTPTRRSARITPRKEKSLDITDTQRHTDCLEKPISDSTYVDEGESIAIITTLDQSGKLTHKIELSGSPSSGNEIDTSLKESLDNEIESLSDTTSSNQQNARSKSSKTEVKEYTEVQGKSDDAKEVSVSAPSTPTRRSARISPQKMDSPGILHNQSQVELSSDRSPPRRSLRLTPDKPKDLGESLMETSSPPTTPTRRNTRLTSTKDDALELRLSPFVENIPELHRSYAQSEEKTVKRSLTLTESSKDASDQQLSTHSPSPSKFSPARRKAETSSPLPETRVLLVKIDSPVKSNVMEKHELNKETSSQEPKIPQTIIKDDKMETEEVHHKLSPDRKPHEDTGSVSESKEASKDVEGADVTTVNKTFTVDSPKSKVVGMEKSSDIQSDNSVESGNRTPRRRSRRLSTSVATPAQSPSISAKEVLAKVSVEHMVELGHTTPLRRSRRLSSTTTTPATPTRSSKRLNVSNLQVTPLPRTRLGATGLGTADKALKSGRKISDVPTPLTKVDLATPSVSVVTPSSRKSSGTKLVKNEVDKVAQKLLLSPERSARVTNSAVEPKVLSSSGQSQDDIPTPPSSPSLRSGRINEPASSSGDPATPGTPSRRSKRISEPASSSADPATPGTPSRRSKRISEPASGSGDPATPGTPSRRSKRISESASGSGDPTTPGTPSRRSKQINEPASSSADPATPETPSVKSPARRSRRRSSVSEQLNLEESKLTQKKGKSSKIELVTVSHDDNLGTPVKAESESPKAILTPSKRSTPSRSRKTPSRLGQGFETLETISEDTEVSSKMESKKSKTPSRTLRSRSSVSESAAEDTTDSPVQSRKRSRKSLGSGDSLAGVVNAKERAASKKTSDSSIDSLSSVNRERTPPSVKESSPEQPVRKSGRKRRPSRRVSESEDEVFIEKPVSTKQEKSSKQSFLKPSADAVKSMTSSPITSVKDSESSEEDERSLRKRISRKRSLRMSNIPAIDDVLSGAKRTTRTSLATKLLHSSSVKSSSLHRSVKSLNIYSEDKGPTIDFTPEKTKTRKSSKKSTASDDSVLIIHESDDTKEMVFTSEMDRDQNVDNVVPAESPEIALKLLDAGKTVKRLRRSSLLKKSMISQGRKFKMPRRSVSSLKLYSEPSEAPGEDSETESSKVKKPLKSIRRTTKDLEASVLEIESGSQAVSIDINENKKSNKESKLMIEVSTDSEKKVEKEEVTSKPQFIFAEPKPVITARQSRALQSLMGEAVEFLFSPPQPQGRIVKTHAKIEKTSSHSDTEKARSSSEREVEETFVKHSKTSVKSSRRK